MKLNFFIILIVSLFMAGSLQAQTEENPQKLPTFLTEELMKSLFLPTEIPSPSVDFFGRRITSIENSQGAESLYKNEFERNSTSTKSGQLVFTEESIASIGPRGYAFHVTPSRITVSAHSEEGFTLAIAEMTTTAYQNNGKLPQGLFVNKDGPVFEYRAFAQPFHDPILRDLNAFYEVGRLATILGYNHLSVGIEVSIMDTSGLSIAEYPGKDVFHANTKYPSQSKVREVFVSLKKDYPINVDPNMQIAKLGDDFIGVKEEYTVECGRGNKRNCYDITRPDLPQKMASLVKLAYNTVAMDIENAAGEKGDTFFISTDEPYVILLDHPDLPAGKTYAEYINAVIEESEKLVEGITFYGWHDPFYCDPKGKIRPSNGCKGWPRWLYRRNLEKYPGCSINGVRGPLEEGRKFLNKKKFHPAIWIYNDYSVAEYQSVIDLFLREGFTKPLCAVWGDKLGPKDNIFNFGEACQKSGGQGLIQTSFTSMKAHSELIVVGSLVSRYGSKEWMKTITDEQLREFSGNLGFEGIGKFLRNKSAGRDPVYYKRSEK